MQSRKVLILTSEPMLAAFLGMLLELEAYEPVFADPGERAEDALTRHRPLLVILLEIVLDAARSDLFFARAAKRGVHVLLFRTPGTAPGVTPATTARDLPLFEMPIDRAELSQLIRDAVRTQGQWRSGGERRREASTEEAADGTLLFSDQAGSVWRVYDRRGTERRAHPAATADETTYRIFVNDAGEERRYQPALHERLDITASALARQLSMAVTLD